MLAYGYRREDETDFPDALREASLVCTKQELDALIGFLQDVRQEVQNADKLDGEHWHFRDWNESWTEKQSDFILFLTSKSSK